MSRVSKNKILFITLRIVFTGIKSTVKRLVENLREVGAGGGVSRGGSHKAQFGENP